MVESVFADIDVENVDLTLEKLVKDSEEKAAEGGARLAMLRNDHCQCSPRAWKRMLDGFERVLYR